MLSSLNIDTRAVCSFYLQIEKRLYSKEKKSQILLNIYGNTRDAVGLSFTLFPYMKIFLRRECPCKSQ
jgi:hypothetical protein